MISGQQFGGKITPELISEYSKSPNWKNNSFQNSVETAAAPGLSKFPSIIYKQIKGHKNQFPSKQIEINLPDWENFRKEEEQFFWFGHSAMLLQLSGKTILIDPMLGNNAAPVAPFAIKRFSENTLSIADRVPAVDIILISHDHYDHLDYASIVKLLSKTSKFFVALGVKRHLVRWGANSEKIVEFDWWDSREFDGIHVHFTPTRHFAGRGLSDRGKSFWGGWYIESESSKIWFSGDSGYGEHFKEIGDKLGPPDIAFMECGQYCLDWPQIHMFPKESVQAALDVGVKTAIPVHWAGFSLSYQHSWFEPAEEFFNYAKQFGLNVSFPHPGDSFKKSSIIAPYWWNKYI
ncbi:MAG: MBL fold metallo-hydrolase [Bacteroidia bacterium]